MADTSFAHRGEHGQWHHSPAWLWLLSYLLTATADAMLGRWLFLPLYVLSFYGGAVVTAVVIYPFLNRWRRWLHAWGVRAWYAIQVGLIWAGITLALTVLSRWWLPWRWAGPPLFQFLGGMLMVVAVSIGFWAAGQMGWARLLLVGALFPPAGDIQAPNVSQTMVVQGPYRYVRNPLYVADIILILGTALLTERWALVLLLGIYVADLRLQIRLEEQELRERFGEPYIRYCAQVPRFFPRLTPFNPREIQ